MLREYHIVAQQCLHCCKSNYSNIMEIGIFGDIKTPKTPKPINKKIHVGNYFGDVTPYAKIQNDHPIGHVLAYGWNITLSYCIIRGIESFRFLPFLLQKSKQKGSEQAFSFQIHKII